MSAERRHIPINQPPAGRAADAGAGRASAPGPGAPGPLGTASAAGARPDPAGSAPGGGHAAPAGKGHGGAGSGRGANVPAVEIQGLVAERDALVAERDALMAERDTLAGERDTLNDSLLRLRAEFDNYRRRTSREVFDAGARAQCDLLGSMLPVLDNLDRALDAAEHHEEGKVLDGVRLTRKMFVDLLACAGVEEIAGVGSAFDPNLHEAIMVQASAEDEGNVAIVLQKGYRQGDRVLRPAKVAVSAGTSEPAVAG